MRKEYPNGAVTFSGSVNTTPATPGELVLVTDESNDNAPFNIPAGKYSVKVWTTGPIAAFPSTPATVNGSPLSIGDPIHVKAIFDPATNEWKRTPQIDIVPNGHIIWSQYEE